MRPYASETCTLPRSDKRQLNLFERRILRKMFSLVKERGAWRRRYNLELYNLYDEPDVVTFIKPERLE